MCPDVVAQHMGFERPEQCNSLCAWQTAEQIGFLHFTPAVHMSGKLPMDWKDNGALQDLGLQYNKLSGAPKCGRSNMSNLHISSIEYVLILCTRGIQRQDQSHCMRVCIAELFFCGHTQTLPDGNANALQSRHVQERLSANDVSAMELVSESLIPVPHGLCSKVRSTCTEQTRVYAVPAVHPYGHYFEKISREG